MRWFSCLALLLLSCTLVVGCGNDREKGINKDRDKPKAADKLD